MIDGSKKTIVSWLLNFRIRMFVKSAAMQVVREAKVMDFVILFLALS